MTQATTSTFGDMQILVGDGASPEVFSPICGLTSKGINYDSTTQDTETPDCTNEDAPSYQETGVTAQKVTVSGSGVWAAQSHGLLFDWWKSGLPKNIQINYRKALTGDLKTLAGPAVLTSMQHTGDKGTRLKLGNLAIAFTAMPTETAAA